MTAKNCLAPIISSASTVLILGSLPGDISLHKQQYYANPRNHFWTILAAVFGTSSGPTYSEKIEFILSNKLALWDVLKAADRKGSLDTSIKNAEANDFQEFLSMYPTIATIALNGGRAAKDFRSIRNSFPEMFAARRCIELPSTSGVPGKNVLSLAAKIERWSTIRTADNALQPIARIDCALAESRQ